MNIKDLHFRFNETRSLKLFSEIRSSVSLRLEVPPDIECKLEQQLGIATKFCESTWNSTQPALYRARKNDFEQLDKYARKHMGPPPADAAQAGRAQIAGVSMFYIADTPETAIAEVKPDVGEFITVAKFRIKAGTELKVLDLTRISEEIMIHWNARFDLLELSLKAFPAQANPANPKKYYAHNYFVQKVQDLGYDGIGYKSAVTTNGRCFAFFNSNHFRCTQTQLHQVRSVSISSERVHFSPLDKQHVRKKKANA